MVYEVVTLFSSLYFKFWYLNNISYSCHIQKYTTNENISCAILVLHFLNNLEYINITIKFKKKRLLICNDIKIKCLKKKRV